MTGAPTLQVLLDDGSGSWATDITDYVRLPDSASVSGFGRGDEFSQAQASSLTLTLDNADSRFTDGTVTLTPDETLIRFTLTSGATTADRFTGRIATLQQQWPGGGQEFATITVTANDPLADLGRKTLRSMLEQEILLDGPTAYYTLGEAEGSTTAGDTSGNGAPSLQVTGTGPAVVFGNGTGPVDGLTAAQFAATSTDTAQYLSAASPAGFTTGGSWSLEAFMDWTGLASTSMTIQLDNGANSVAVALNAFGVVFFLSTSHIVTGPSTNATHHFVMTFDGTNLKGYVDGVQVVTATSSLGATLINLAVGAEAGNGTISHVAIYDGVVLSSTRVAAHAAVLSGFVETTVARLTRLAAYAGFTATTTDPSGQIMGAQSTSGQSLYDAMQQVALAEGGVFFADGSGALQMQGRSYRGLRTTPDLTLTSDAVDPDTSVTWDTQQKFNQVTVSRTGGATQVAATAGVLALTDTVFPSSLELAVDTDAHALEHAQWIVSKYQTTTPRLGSAVLDLLTSSSAATILGLNLGARLSLTPMPSQMWAGTTDYVIEGWSETVSDTEWSMTVNLLPWSLFEAALYNTSPYVYDDAGSVYSY